MKKRSRTFQQQLRNHVVERGICETERLSGICKGQLSGWTNKKRCISVDAAERIIQALGLRVKVTKGTK